MKLEHTSRSCDVTTPRTNLRSQSVTMAKMLRLRKSASSASGVDGVMIVYGVAAVRLNFDMYFSTLSSYRVVVQFGETREKGNQHRRGMRVAWEEMFAVSTEILSSA